MLVLPFLSNPADVSPADTPAELSEQADADARSESKSTDRARTYATPVAFAYVIPMSVAVTSAGLLYATRDSGPVAGGFLFTGALGLLGGVVAPPIVHLAHANIGSAAASFGGSLLATTTGGFLGLILTLAAWEDGQDDDSVPTSVVGITAGAVLFQGVWGLIDANELAYETGQAADVKRAVSRPAAVPFAVPRDNGLVLGFQGMF